MVSTGFLQKVDYCFLTNGNSAMKIISEKIFVIYLSGNTDLFDL